MKNASRIRLISLAVIVFAVFLVIKLYYVQIVSGDAFDERADRQYLRPTGSAFDRGTIFFSAKDGTLMAAASLKTGYTVAINPKILKNPEDVYSRLSQIIDIDKDSFFAKALKTNDTYEEIAKRIEQAKADQIVSLSISGVSIYKEKWRNYPGESLAAQTIGFVGYNNSNELGGRYGLENYYDSILKRNEQNVYVNFFAEIFSDIHKTFTDTGTAQGDVVATIEPTVEAYVEKQIEEVNKKFSSKSTGAIVINPQNGEIYAMGAVPSFNPNTFQAEKSVSVFTNPLVQNVYEMGSIVKPITMAAGIDAGVVSANTKYNDAGSLTLNGKTIYNFDKRGRGVVDMQEVLNQSLNTGVAFVANKVGNDRFSQYLYNFGFGKLTGIDLPNEAKGLVDNLKSNRDIEHATASFGQGIALSPMAITRALSVLANGGKLITPHVTKKIDYTVGFSKTPEFPAYAQVIKPEAAKEVSRMLTVVVDKALLNGEYKMEHYSIAAKTGTAQIAKPSGGYYEDRYLHSFFGYFPATDPKFLVFLYTVEPQGEMYASHTMTEPFMNIAKFLINYYEVPPDR